MDEYDGLLPIIVFVFLGFVVGTLFGVMIERNPSYKRGQLDFQRGKVEWLLVGPDEVHHVLKEKE